MNQVKFEHIPFSQMCKSQPENTGSIEMQANMTSQRAHNSSANHFKDAEVCFQFFSIKYDVGCRFFI
jgi:hypothetical protein